MLNLIIGNGVFELLLLEIELTQRKVCADLAGVVMHRWFQADIKRPLKVQASPEDEGIGVRKMKKERSVCKSKK